PVQRRCVEGDAVVGRLHRRSGRVALHAADAEEGVLDLDRRPVRRRREGQPHAGELGHGPGGGAGMPRTWHRRRDCQRGRNGERIFVEKDMGLVTNVFNDYNLAALTGHLAIGHTRYSTTGSSTWRNAQPVYREPGESGFALGHNGNLTNTADLAGEAGMLPG